MFYAVSNALKKRLVLIFQEIFLEHPIFKKVEVFTKFPKEERPKHALMVRSVSGSSQKIGMDNFVRYARQFSSLGNLQGIPGNAIEWVRDDDENIDKISAPGFYIIRMVSDTSFIVEPYLLVDDEELNIEFIEGKKGAWLQNKPINPNSEIIYLDDRIEFKRNIDYTIDYNEGKVLFNTDIDENQETITIDYQIVEDFSEEITVEPYTADNSIIPGVILAFGDRLEKGSEQVVIVEKEQRDVAKVYGGRWQLSCDLIGVSQDDDQQERIVDYAISMFWAHWQDRLVNEGINVYDFSLSGESEDIEVEIPEDYFYTGGISFTAETDWELHVPLISEVRRVSVYYGNEGYKETISNEKEAQYETSQFDRRMVNSGHDVGIQIIPSEPLVIYPQPPLKVTTIRYPRPIR